MHSKVFYTAELLNKSLFSGSAGFQRNLRYSEQNNTHKRGLYFSLSFQLDLFQLPPHRSPADCTQIHIVRTL